MTSAPAVVSVADLLGAKYTQEFQEAFPDVAPPFVPFGYLALLQLRQPRKKSGSIILPDSELATERFRTQATLVRALGPACFKDRKTFEVWPEGEWFKAGDFVRCPMYGGDRFEVNINGANSADKVTFVFIKEADALGLVIGNPLSIVTS